MPDHRFSVRAPLRRRVLPAALPTLAGRVMLGILLSLTLLIATSSRSASADSAPPPHGMIVMLDIRMPSSRITCTGFMIGPHTIATTGHCLYNRELGGWATSAFVTPGIDGLNAPFGTEFTTTFAVAPGWAEHGDLELDYGAITLDSDALGTATGWFAVSSAPDIQLGRGRYATAGYGTAVPPTTVWKMPEPAGLAEWDPEFLIYRWGTTTGVSGAPIFEATAEGRYRVVGLVKGAFGRTERMEFGVRVTQPVETFFREQAARPVVASEPTTIPTMFTTTTGTAVRIASPMTRPNTESVLQASSDEVNWSTVATATTDARGVADYTVTPTETRYYRVVVRGIGTGRVGRGLVSGSASVVGNGRGFAAIPTYSPTRLALAVFRGGSADDLGASLRTANASAAWVQDSRGQWNLYIVGGTFLNEEFMRAFPAGFTSATPMTLVAA